MVSKKNFACEFSRCFIHGFCHGSRSLSLRTLRCVDRQDTALKRRDLAAILCFRGPEEGVASVP